MSSLKNYLRSKQRFELELNGVRTIVMSSKIFEALENGTVDLNTRIWIDGCEGRLRDIDERVIEGESFLFLKNTPLEKLILDCARGKDPNPAATPTPLPQARAPRPTSGSTPLPPAPLPRVNPPAERSESALPPIDPRPKTRDDFIIEPLDRKTAYQKRGIRTKIAIFAVTVLIVCCALLLLSLLSGGTSDESGSAKEESAASAPAATTRERDGREIEQARSDLPSGSGDRAEHRTDVGVFRDVFENEDEASPSDDDLFSIPDAPTVAEEDPKTAATTDGADAEAALTESLPAAPESGKQPKSGATFCELPFAETPFSPVGGRVPLSYRGINVDALAQKFFDAVNVDREEEGLTDYQYAKIVDKKRRAVMNESLLGGIAIGSYVAVCWPPKKALAAKDLETTEYVVAKYNGDVDAATLSCTSSSKGDNPFIMTLGLDQKTFSGFKQRIRETQSRNAGVIYRATPKSGAKGDEAVADCVKEWKLKKVDSKFAERLDSLAVCCVGRLELCDKALWEQYKTVRKEAYGQRYNAVFLDSVEYWVYDYYTGEVFAKYTANDVRRGVSKRVGDLSAGSKRFDSAATEPVKDWPDVFAESRDDVEDWEIAPPDLAVPQDAPTLVDALKMARDGDVIQVSASDTLIPFGDAGAFVLDKSVSIVGATGNPDDAVIELTANQIFTVDSKVNIKGVSFLRTNEARAKSIPPMIRVKSGKATFKFCIFDGNAVEESTGVDVVGGQANFWKCAFCQFRSEGAHVREKGVFNAEYCEIGDDNTNGVRVMSGGAVNITRSLFYGNERAFTAQEGGGGVVQECFFKANLHPWAISSGSSRAVKKIDVILAD